MKGYYTVRLVAEGFTAAQRMAIEARYVSALRVRRCRRRCGEPGLREARFQVQACAAVDLA